MNKVRKYRIQKNIPVEKLINYLGLKTPSAYYKKERGELNFSINEAILLSRLFGIPVEDLFPKVA